MIAERGALLRGGRDRERKQESDGAERGVHGRTSAVALHVKIGMRRIRSSPLNEYCCTAI